MAHSDDLRSPPRVALQVLTRPVGGAAIQVFELSRALEAFGVRSPVVIGRDTQGEGSIESGETITIPSLARAIRPASDIRALRAIGDVIARFQPSVVHTHQAKGGALGRIAAKRRRVPVVCHTFHGYAVDANFSGAFAGAVLRAERWLARRTNALIAPSASLRDELLARGVGIAEQWHVIPYGIDTERFAPLPREQSRIACGLSSSGTVVGIVGRLAPVKDHELFLRVAARVAGLFEKCRFVVAGDGELRADLERTGHDLLHDRIRFLGHVDDLRPLYSSLDLLVVTSRSEGTPVAVLEAAAAGVPTVAVDVGGIRELIDDGVNGVVVRRDEAALAAAIVDLLEAPDARRAMGVAAQSMVEDRFALSRLGERTAGLYGSLVFG